MGHASNFFFSTSLINSLGFNLFSSKFMFLSFFDYSFIRRFRVLLLVKKNKKRQNLPEILFWFLFFIFPTKKFFISYFDKKSFFGGLKDFTKTFSYVAWQTWNFCYSIRVWYSVFNYLFSNAGILNLYYYQRKKNYGSVFSISLKNLRFDLRFYRFMTVGAWFWQDFNISMDFYFTKTHTSQNFFLLQLLNMPLLKQ